MRKGLLLGGVAVGAGLPIGAQALDLGIDRLNITGVVRQEMAHSISRSDNPFNQYGNPFNNKAMPSTGYGPNGFLPIFPVDLNPARIPGATGPTAYTANGHSAYFLDEGFNDDPSWNVFNTRLEVDVQYQFTDNLNGYLKLRGYADGTDNFSRAFDKTNFFNNAMEGDRAGLLEVSGEQYSLDFPAAYLDFRSGSLWLRAGNQQIAWGEAYFYRVLDVVNGLDLRRHSILDVAAEEYSDKRVASPGLRVSYTFDQGAEIDAFVQRFAPSVYGNENTPYNVIPSQFVINQEPGYDEAENSVNFGARLSYPVGDLTLQVMGVSRRNPDGVFRWDQVPANEPGAVCFPGQGCTPFQGGGQGVYSAQEWFASAARARLNGVDGLQSVYNEFPAAEAIRQFNNGLPGFAGLVPVGGILPTVSDKNAAIRNLDFFFAGGPLRGWLTREYKREEVFGAAANYIITANPDSFFDQMVLRGEVSYTPDKKFTNPTLSRNYIEEDEIAASAVIEKYHRFGDALPATYMVLQWMFKSESDLYGRHLSGMGNKGFDDPDGRPDGDSDTFNSFAFVMQQPFPNLIWRADFALLVDVEGGYLVQPGVRYKPAAEWQFDLYANIIGSNGNQNDIMETIEWADEIFARVSFFF